MKDFIEEFSEISARIRRDLVLIDLAQDWERESWMDEEDMEPSETLRILDVYRDRTTSALSSLDFQIRELLDHLSNTHRNP